MGLKAIQRSPAFPPVFTSYKLLEIERKPLGYDLKENLGQAEQTRRYFHQRTDGICPVEYWHWAHARIV
jgi:hypothetical protein